MPRSNSIANVAETLSKILISIVIYNDATMKNACEDVNIKNFSYFGYTINLLVREILKMDIFQPIMVKCKAIVAFIKQSSTTVA